MQAEARRDQDLSVTVPVYKQSATVYEPDTAVEACSWSSIYCTAIIRDLAWFHAAGLKETADRLVGNGTIPPALLVLPKLGNSWYVDSDAFGPVETAFIGNFYAGRGPAWRPQRPGIAGISMGGFGVPPAYLPETFAATAISPTIVTDVDHGWRSRHRSAFGPAFGDPFDATGSVKPMFSAR